MPTSGSRSSPSPQSPRTWPTGAEVSRTFLRLRPHVRGEVRGNWVTLVGDRAYQFPAAMLEPLTKDFLNHAWIDRRVMDGTLGLIHSAVAVRALADCQLLQWIDEPASMPVVEAYPVAALLELPPRELAGHRVAVIGCGGIGGELARHLAANGIRQLVLVDNDVVSQANLNRQYLYTEVDVGRPKVSAATTALLALQPQLQVETLEVAIRNAADLQLLDRHRPTVVVCCADSPKDIGQLLSDYACQRGAVFGIASAGLDEVSWGPIVAPDSPTSYLAWSASVRAPAGISQEPLAYSFGPTNSLTAAALARDLIHVLLGESAPSWGAQVTYNLRTLQITRAELVSE